MKRRKVLYVLAVLFALCLLCFAGCNEDKRPTELKSDLGITVSGDRFELGVELVTTRLKLSDERVREALKKLPEEYFSSDDSEIAAIDIALVSGGERIQPQQELELRVPAPLEGAKDYVVYQVIGDEVKKVNFVWFEDEVIRLRTSTFSVFLFRDSMVKRSLTVVVEGPCAGNVKVEIPESFHTYYTKYYLNNGEQQTFDLSGVKRAVKLSASSPENYKFIGWFESIDGVMEKEPISTDESLEYEVKGRRTLVARTEAELSGVSGIWAFPGESNFPVGFGDGRAATQVYVRPGNAQNLDAGKLLIKAYKESEGNGVYINVSPYQYDVEGLNEIDYSKEGDYRVRFVAKENEDLVAEVVVHVSESVVNLRAITNGNGKFRVDGGKEKYNDKTFAITDTTDRFELEAERYDDVADFKFKGWYRYLDGGILGEKLSDSEKFTLSGDMGDLTVIALYKALSSYENLFGVYQLRLFPGESGIPVDESNERGEIESLLYYRPNEAQIEVFRVEVKGLRRSNSEGLELVTLGYGDYEIDYDGLDFGKEGTYEVKFKAELQGDESYYTTISISIFKEYAALTVEFDGNGSLKGSIVDPASGTSYGKKDMTESGKKYVLGAFMRSNYRSIVATPDEGYRFAGWYAVDENGNLSEEPISTDAEYRFTQNGKDEHIKAVFEEKVTAITATCEGFADGNFVYVDGIKPDLSKIVVKDNAGRTLSESEYEVDDGAVDYEVAGVYEIVITYKNDESVKTTLTVTVPKPIDNLEGVYQLRLFPGESGIPVDESSETGELESLLYYRPNEAQIDVSKVVVKGLRRAAEGNGFELVDLRPGDYEIDYDGLDFGKEGTYKVKFKAKLQGNESYYVTISISIFKEYAALTVEFDGNGSLKGSIVDPASGTSYGKKDMTESGKKYVLGAFMRSNYRSIVATPDEGYRFAGWYAVDENGNLSEEPISTDAEYRFTQNGKDEHIKAVFVNEVLAYVYIDSSIGDVNGVIKKGDEIIVKDPDGHPEFMGAGETLTLTAVPNDGYKFSGWYTAHDYGEEKKFYSANATETFTVQKDVQIYAVFAEKNNVTIKAYVSNEYGKIGKDLPDGVTSWEDSVEITVKEGDAVQLTARPSYEYVRFAGWFDGENYENLISAEATHTFTVTENVSVYAKFDLSFTVSAKIEGGGEFADYPDKTEIAFENLPSGSTVELKVKAKEGYEFAGWFDKNEGFFVENNLSYTAKVYAYQGLSTGNIHLVARFRKAVTELKLETSDASGFRTDENGNFITEYKVNKNSEFYAMPSAVRVLGKAGDAFELLTYEREYRIESTINYSENGMFDTSKSGDYTVTYIYLANPAVRAIVTIKVVETLRFDVSVTPAGSGYIADENGEEIDVGGGFDVESGTQITLKATAYVGNMYKFVGWFDESTQQSVLISENAQHTFTVNSHMRVSAKFEANPYFIAFTEGNGTIKMNGEIASFGNGIHVDKGTQITLTAEPGENSVFVGWFDESERQSVLVSANATETFTVNTDTRLCAKFRNKLESIEIMTESDGSYEDAIYKNVELGGQYRPDPEEILVTGVYKGEDQQASLTLGRDYTVDKGGLNYDVRGTYTVTYTVVGQPEVFAKLIIRVLAKGDYSDAWLRLPQDINIAGEDSNGVLIAEFVIGGNPFDLTKATFAAYALGQQEETTLVYSTDFTIDYGGLDYTKAGRYLVKFIPNGCPELTESIIIAVYNPKTVEDFTEITTADSGFSMDNNYNYSARYKIGDSFRPDPEQVQIYGKYYGEADSHILELGTDYVIDRGNLDYEVPGRYEITFSAVTNPGISLIMIIIVEA